MKTLVENPTFASIREEGINDALFTALLGLLDFVIQYCDTLLKKTRSSQNIRTLHGQRKKINSVCQLNEAAYGSPRRNAVRRLCTRTGRINKSHGGNARGVALGDYLIGRHAEHLCGSADLAGRR